MTKTFKPDWASPPGATILDCLKEKGYNRRWLAKKLCVSQSTMDRLIHGEAKLTDSVATRLGALGWASEQFWINREKQYRDWLKEHK